MHIFEYFENLDTEEIQIDAYKIILNEFMRNGGIRVKDIEINTLRIIYAFGKNEAFF